MSGMRWAIVWAVISAVAFGCAGAPPQEQQGQVRPEDRALTPPAPGQETDGPTQPRTAPMRPPAQEQPAVGD